MAGSWNHINTEGNEFYGVCLLDHLGDAYEALEECWFIIRYTLTEAQVQEILDGLYYPGMRGEPIGSEKALALIASLKDRLEKNEAER